AAQQDEGRAYRVGHDAERTPDAILRSYQARQRASGQVHFDNLGVLGPRQYALTIRANSYYLPAAAGACTVFTSNSAMSSSNFISSSTPSPVLQFVKTKGFFPRISLESRSITSRLAPT